MMHIVDNFINYLTYHPVLSPICSASITAMVAGVIALMTIKKQRQTARENNSLSFEKDYQRCEYVRKAWVVIREKVIKNKPYFPIERYAEAGYASTEEATAIRDILNEWERAANAINHNLYDDGLLYNAFGSSVLFLRTEFQPYIEKRQNDTPSYYQNFMSMSLRWRIRKDNEKSSRVKSNQCCCKKCGSVITKNNLFNSV